jgi:hypothetical protein
MVQELIVNGKTYRVTWDDIGLANREGPAGLICNVSDRREEWMYTGLPCEITEDVRQHLFNHEVLKNRT